MSQSSIQIETGNVVRINNGTGFNTSNFYRLKYMNYKKATNS